MFNLDLKNIFLLKIILKNFKIKKYYLSILKRILFFIFAFFYCFIICCFFFCFFEADIIVTLIVIAIFIGGAVVPMYKIFVKKKIF